MCKESRSKRCMFWSVLIPLPLICPILNMLSFHNKQGAECFSTTLSVDCSAKIGFVAALEGLLKVLIHLVDTNLWFWENVLVIRLNLHVLEKMICLLLFKSNLFVFDQAPEVANFCVITYIIKYHLPPQKMLGSTIILIQGTEFYFAKIWSLFFYS